MTAFSAILRALIKRGISNQGMDLSISMFDVMADWMNMPLVSHRYMGGAPKRLGLSHALIAPYGAFDAADGQILIAIQSNREWNVFCAQILDQPELGDDKRFQDNTERVTNRDALHEIINQRFSQFSKQDMIAQLDRARIANAQLSSVADLSSHEFIRDLTIQFGETKIDIADLPVKIETSRQTVVPTLNQHGDKIRNEYQNQ